MQSNTTMRIDISSISRQIERKELKKFSMKVIRCLSVFLSIWFETITEVDTLKIRKKGVKHNGVLFIPLVGVIGVELGGIRGAFS